MPYQLITSLGVTIGTPFNGAVPGTSVTVNSVVMRGSTCHSGRYNRLFAQNTYSPLYSTSFVRPQVFTNINPSPSVAPLLRLPFITPISSSIVGQTDVYISNYTAISSSSFTAPTVNSIVMRASTCQTADYKRLAYRPSATNQYNLIRTISTMAVDLNVFGLINRMIFMDY